MFCYFILHLLKHIWNDHVFDCVAILLPIFSILRTATCVITICTVEQQNGQVNWISIGQQAQIAWHRECNGNENVSQVIDFSCNSPPTRNEQITTLSVRFNHFWCFTIDICIWIDTEVNLLVI